jgi:predicted alpha-1,6-mannanase (GH76 family)
MSPWADRADAAERAICGRSLRRLWGLPRTRLGVASARATPVDRLFLRWNYWWQAQLLDCLVDAQGRNPLPGRQEQIARLVRGFRIRNGGRWVNDYFDDIAWLGLAVERARLEAEVDAPGALPAIAVRLRSGWTDHAGGGIWWRRGDDFKNVPANGPAAILFARLAEQGERADLQRAKSTVEWIEANLVDGESGVVYDGLHVNADGSVREIERAVYTYCHGVFLGACVELSELDGSPVWALRAARTVSVVARHMTAAARWGPVIRGQGGGDGGMFAGILARYLARAALVLPDEQASAEAAGIVYASADAAWANRVEAADGPLFGEEWATPAPSDDLSVQLSAWAALEAAALLAHGEVPDTRTSEQVG